MYAFIARASYYDFTVIALGVSTLFSRVTAQDKYAIIMVLDNSEESFICHYVVNFTSVLKI